MHTFMCELAEKLLRTLTRPKHLEVDSTKLAWMSGVLSSFLHVIGAN